MPPARKPRPKRYGAEGGGRWARMVAHVVQRDAGLCHICGHFGGKSADHLIPVTERPDLALEVSNLKAAHAYPNGCPECSAASVARGGKPVYCNELRGMGSVARARRIIEERTGAPLAQPDPRSSPPTREGRDIW